MKVKGSQKECVGNVDRLVSRSKLSVKFEFFTERDNAVPQSRGSSR